MKTTSTKILLIMIICAFLLAVETQAQTCRAPEFLLVAHDKKGNVIDPATLDEPKWTEGGTQTFSYFDGGNVGRDIKIIRIRGNPACVATLDTLTLRQGKTAMRLNFKLLLYSYNPPKERGDFRLFNATFMEIKLPPMQNGTFEYVPADHSKGILSGWKKISATAPTVEK